MSETPLLDAFDELVGLVPEIMEKSMSENETQEAPEAPEVTQEPAEPEAPESTEEVVEETPAEEIGAEAAEVSSESYKDCASRNIQAKNERKYGK